MSRCYFRLFVVFEIAIFKIAMIFYACSMYNALAITTNQNKSLIGGFVNRDLI